MTAARPGVHPPITAVREAVARALAEDLEPLGDLTAALLPAEARATATFTSRATGVVAGRRCVEVTIASVDAGLDLRWHLDDGAEVAPGEVIAEVEGPLASILTAERTALNFLCHLSGVASLTRRYVEAAGGGARIWDTRKTTPGLRALEKAAVRAGGGANHRGNLSEWVLLKDNHLTGLGITAAVGRARERWPARVVEVEADRLEQVEEAIAAGADLVLLDNMSPDEARACVEARGDAARPLLEVSGRVSLETVAAYAATGVDLISVGALTHSAPVLDIGLDIAPREA
ncbi:MAG TPA: carboxylating nicotinate-nucleotide diphosphorylase [Acidimicrobiales bacterium]|nr:carboxylating nicotinate-nucleotide diphosphorylase [Acidimicrobiales bacterium]